MTIFASDAVKSIARLAFPHPLTASEQLFYLGAPLAHVAAYEQRLREARLQGQVCQRQLR